MDSRAITTVWWCHFLCFWAGSDVACHTMPFHLPAPQYVSLGWLPWGTCGSKRIVSCCLLLGHPSHLVHRSLQDFGFPFRFTISKGCEVTFYFYWSYLQLWGRRECQWGKGYKSPTVGRVQPQWGGNCDSGPMIFCALRACRNLQLALAWFDIQRGGDPNERVLQEQRKTNSSWYWKLVNQPILSSSSAARAINFIKISCSKEKLYITIHTDNANINTLY